MRGRRQVRARLAAVGCGLVTLLGFGAAAGAAPAYGPPAGWTELGDMAIGPADFPGARIATQGYVKPDTDSLAEYDRSLAGAKVGGQRLTFLENDIDVYKTVDKAQLTVDAIPLGVLLYSGQLAKSFSKSTGQKVTYTKVGRPQGLGAGNDSVGIVVHLGTRSGEIRVVFAVFRIGSLDSLVTVLGTPRQKIGVTQAKLIAQTGVRHIRAGLVPANTVAPTTSGTVQVGQSLAAQNGTWLSSPVSYSYQWARCDAAGANCAPIAGATTQSYVIGPADAGTTLAVIVTASNAYGSASATSAATFVVPPEPPPPPPPAP
jgi:hypothetical protein